MGRFLHVILLVALVAGVAAAQAPYEKVPGSLYRGVELTGTLLVKFVESAEVRVRNAELVSESGRDLTGIRRLLAEQPGARVARLFERSETELARERQEAAARTREPMPNLNDWVRIDFDDTVDLLGLVDALNRFPEVAIAYPESVATEPLATPDFTSKQEYRNAPADGVNAIYGNRFPGGTGAGIQVIDFERGWIHNHEDLGSPAHLWGTLRSGSRHHGAAVLGEIVGVKNAYGVTGIAYGAKAKTVSYYTSTTSNGLNKAVGFSKAGDFILLEVQISGPGGYAPVEWDRATFDVIKIATGKGIHIFEAAGNGRQDLDDVKWGGRFNRTKYDSGAVMCAASNGKSLAPASFTNYGTRIDAHGWGYNVTSAGYGGLYQGTGEHQYYTATFSGTSSASPIVTGAGMVIESVSRKLTGKGLAPLALRSLITATGTPPAASTKWIGPRPDLKRALSRVGAHLSTDGLAWPGRVVPLDLVDIDSSGKGYAAAVALADQPGIKLSDNRVIPLAADPVLFMSISGLFTWFIDFRGTLDAKGYGTARLTILPDSRMVGVTLHSAFIVLDGSASAGVGTISNPWPITVTTKP